MKDLHDLDDKIMTKIKHAWMSLREWQKVAVGVVLGVVLTLIFR
jgi:hypothetical protein